MRGRLVEDRIEERICKIRVIDGVIANYYPQEELIRCKDCEHHGNRTNMCDIFHCHTNPNGYCHRGRIYGQAESGTESK